MLTAMSQPDLIWIGGLIHFCTLLGSAQVPRELRFREDLPKLNPLLRQWVLVAGVYIVFNILSFGLISVVYSKELTAGSPLSRVFCGYVSLFWGMRLFIQFFIFDARPYLTRRFLRVGYHGLTLVFAWQTLVYGSIAIGR